MTQKKIKILNLLHLRSKKEMSEALELLHSLTSKLEKVTEVDGALASQLEHYLDLTAVTQVSHLRSQIQLTSTLYSEIQNVKDQKNLLEKETLRLKSRVRDINFKSRTILSRIEKAKLEINK